MHSPRISFAIARRATAAREAASLDHWLQDVEAPPIDAVGARSLDALLSEHEGRTLASPTFSSWR